MTNGRLRWLKLMDSIGKHKMIVVGIIQTSDSSRLRYHCFKQLSLSLFELLLQSLISFHGLIHN